MSYRMTLSVLLLLLCAALPAAAQQVNIAATVPVASPTGGGVRNLTFGVVTPAGGSTQIVDVPAAVAPQTALVQSGEFRFNVAGARGIDFTVTVPTELTSAGAPPLLISFNGNQYGGYCVTTAASCTLTNFNPSLGQVLRVCRTMLFGFCIPIGTWPSGNTLRVYVGGRLSVPPSARAGVYTGTVTMTIIQVF